ncbi:unnamed protein product [Clonostachys rosea]|uniref:Transcription factor domain-containing protein n=1 Tax=Bionectria ochroleuca TaxID=29856 RepID=A0ABY6U5Z3_BIOOC|nr:unnamed protein product [Clonostachys rosea]
MAGRRSTIREDDIGWPSPSDHPLLANLCRAGAIMEDVAASLYNCRTDTLGNLYYKAQALHDRLKQWGGSMGIGSLSPSRSHVPNDPLATLTLHNVYFYITHTIFRPFLITEFALMSERQAKEPGDLWLRQACRHASDAATDSILFMESMLDKVDFSKIRRQDAFYIEASCVILLFDSLRHPSKHANNLLYINTALTCLRAMVQDEPVTSVAISITRILNAVVDAIRDGGGDQGISRIASDQLLQESIPAGLPNSAPETSVPDPYHGSLLDFGHQQGHERGPVSNDFLVSSLGFQSAHMPQSASAFDLLTIDLSSYFPLEMESDDVP